MQNQELNLIRAIKDDVIYLILMRKFDRPVHPLELSTILKVTPVIAYCTPYSSCRPLLDLDGDSPHKRTFDSFVLRRALAREPLNEV